MPDAERRTRENRRRAESFGAVADTYDRARPSYPPALIDELIGGPAASLSVLDVGCGTGIAARALRERGCAVLGVEADERMADIARAKGLEVEVSRFEEWSPLGRSFDLVISAQAWHWIDPVRGARRAAEALRAEGRLGLFWSFGEEPAHIHDLTAPIYARLAPGLRRHSHALPAEQRQQERLRTAWAGISESRAFERPQSTSFWWTARYRGGTWLERLSTLSDHQMLPPAQRERLLAALTDALGPAGDFEVKYRTLLISSRRVRGLAPAAAAAMATAVADRPVPLP